MHHPDSMFGASPAHLLDGGAFTSFSPFVYLPNGTPHIVNPASFHSSGGCLPVSPPQVPTLLSGNYLGWDA